MAAPQKYVTQEQHEDLKREVGLHAAALERFERIERIAIRFEVVSHDTSRLLHEVADLREELNEVRDELRDFREEVNTRFEGLEARVGKLEKTVIEGNAALMSAILQLGTSR